MSDGFSVDELFAEFEEQDRRHAARPWWLRTPIDAARRVRGRVSMLRHRPPWRLLRWRWQRSVRGWADCDLWSLDAHLARVISTSVAALRDQSHGYPALGEASSMDAWRDVLTRISEPLSVDHERFIDGETPEEACRRVGREIEAQKEALRLLAEWFPALWD